jgi:spore maturation protein CgeB
MSGQSIDQTQRDILLVAHGSLHPALRRELVGRGLVVRESPSWHAADRSSPERILAAYTWFYEGIRHPVQVWRMHRWLARRNIPLFSWNQDAPHYLNYTKRERSWRLVVAQRLRLFDLYATHTLIDHHRHFAEATLYLPNAADTQRYRLGERSLAQLRHPSAYEWDVSFFGAIDGKRYKEMRRRQEFFAALGERLRARGIRFLFREAAGLDTEAQTQLIQRSRINLNFGASCEYGAPLASGLPERCYGIPASGGFILCDKRTHARDDFAPGENWAEFEGLEGCMAQIEFWLANFGAARDLAERCHAHVLAQHTYANRAEQLHTALIAWHSGKRGRLG